MFNQKKSLHYSDIRPLKWIPVSEPNLSGKEKEYVMDCIESGWISSKGKYIELFEKSVSNYVGSRYAISVCNGTCALHLALLSIGVGNGDEVIVPSFTYVASANAVRYTGALAVFVDCEKDTFNLDVNSLESYISPRTKAIVAVHLYGHPCDMDKILSIAKKHNLYVIEDAAEAFGSEYKGKKIGTIADIGVYSFFGNKTITTGEGGMVVTNNRVFAEKAYLLKTQGVSSNKQYFFEVMGYNYRMTNIEAAIGLAQMENIDDFINKKRKIAASYSSKLSAIRGLKLPIEKSYAKNTYWMYSIVVEDEFGMSRDRLIDTLMKAGIETRPFFYPCHRLPFYDNLKVKLPVCEEISKRGINLPSSTKITEADIDYVANAIENAYRK